MGAMRPVARRKLPAASLVEAIVASILFMSVFAVSLDTLSRLRVGDPELLLIQADRAIQKSFGEYGDGRHENGRYAQEHSWGSLTIVVRPYRVYPDLQEIIIIAEIESLQKRLESRHVIEIQKYER